MKSNLPPEKRNLNPNKYQVKTSGNKGDIELTTEYIETENLLLGYFLHNTKSGSVYPSIPPWGNITIKNTTSYTCGIHPK